MNAKAQQDIISIKTEQAEKILSVIEDYLKVPVEEIKGTSRKRHKVEARQLAFFFIKKRIGDFSLEQIGQVLYRDYTTVIHSIKNVKNLMDTEQAFANLVNKLEDVIPRFKGRGVLPEHIKVSPYIYVGLKEVE